MIINKSFYRRLFIIVLALIISFLYGFKHFLWLHELDWDYKNAVFFTSFEAWDVDHYITQIKEVYEGNYSLSNAYLAEYKNTKQSPWPVFPLYLAASVGKIFHIKVQHLAVLMDLALPPLIFLLAYWFLYTVSPLRSASLLGAFLLVLTPHLFRIDILLYMGFDILQKGFAPPILHNAHCYYCFSGTINPQLTYTFLLATLFFFSKGLNTSKNRFFLLATLLGIITSYSYVYFSSYLYVVLTISAIGLFWLREQKAARKSLLILGTILFCAIPFWYPLLNFSQNELGQMAFMTEDHTPLFHSSYINAHLHYQLLFTLLICGIILYYLRKGTLNKISGLLSFSLLISGIICLEQHVITGIRVQPWHYDAYVNPQSTILALTLVIPQLLHKWRFQKSWTIPLLLYGGVGLVSISVILHPSFVASYLSADGVLTPQFDSFLQMAHTIGLGFGIGCILFNIVLRTRFAHVFHKSGAGIILTFRKLREGSPFRLHPGKLVYGVFIMYVAWDVGFGQYEYYHNILKPWVGYLQELAPALNWLDEHTEKESVILGSPDHTSTNSIIPIYTHNNVYVTFHSQFYTMPSLSEIHDRLYNTMYFMGITSREEFDRYLEDHWFKEGVFEIYQDKLTKDVYSELTRYQVDYLFYGPRERQHFKIDPEKTYSFLQKVYDDGTVAIYQIL